MYRKLPIPEHFDPEKIEQIWKVPYEQRATEARAWAQKQQIRTAAGDDNRICLLLVDVQNTFCHPEFELFVAGRSGTGAIDDNRRLCEFIYRNLGVISEICPTMDTHQAMQIFHSIFFVNEKGEHPAPYTLISAEDVQQGVWKFNPEICQSLNISEEYGQQYLRHYTRKLQEGGKYDLTIWPYHAMLGGIGHALVSAVEEAIFFHSVARYSQPDFQVKGKHPLTENYSVLSPEITEDMHGKQIAQKNDVFLKKLLEFDAVIIAGQAKSHCVAWTIEDLLADVQKTDRKLTEKVYLVEDCMSPVVVPGMVDYTEDADRAFEKFADAGMQIVHSTEPLSDWPGLQV